MSAGSKSKHAKPASAFNSKPEGAKWCDCGRGWYKPPYTHCYACNHPELAPARDDDPCEDGAGA